jgi:UDP-MurNAc hydroxylase
MKFTVLSHAGLLVESQGIKLLIDPWILGSCYWRSWWNYPKPVLLPGQLDDIDAIYITHHHWDHFHGPSLRTLPQSATVFVPKSHGTLLVDDLIGFGFKEVKEIPHGKGVTLGSGLRLTSYHFGFSLDSTLVVDDGETVLVNLNDCKITGFPLRQLMRRHPRIDFLLKSHSSASAYPHCVEADDPRDLQYRTNDDYMAGFVDASMFLKPRYAIPFASNHCFLHKETFRYNYTVVSPIDVKKYFDRHKPDSSECIVMIAGDSWEKGNGFHLRGLEPFTHRDQYLKNYTAEVAPKLEEQYRREEQVSLAFPTFEKYFNALVRSLPRLSRLVFKPLVVFQLTSALDRFWVVDFDRRSVYEAQKLPSEWRIVIRIHPAVLSDCMKRGMFTVFMPSKRLAVRLAKGAVRDFFILTQLLEMYEYGYFPLRKMLTVRFLSAWIRRWREVVFYLSVAARMALAGRKEESISVTVPKIS